MRALSETAATALGIGSMSPDEEVEAQGAKNVTLENMISYSGDAPASLETFDLALFKRLNAEFAAAPLVPAPREQNTRYTTEIGRRRGKMLERKIGIDHLRVIEVGCGDGMLSRLLAHEHCCEVVGVDVCAYDDWAAPAEGDLTYLVHDISTGDNAALGLFDRVVSFAAFEHIVHPHGALKAVYDLLKPNGKAYIYANLYRGAKASHRYREVSFPWPHLLFQASVWQEFYVELFGEPMQAAWVNKLTYDQYVNMAQRVGFRIVEHFPSAPYFNEDFYRRFEYELAAYPKFDLMHDFIHLVLEKPGAAVEPMRDRRSLLDYPPQRRDDEETYARLFWRSVRAESPDWLGYEARWRQSRRNAATAIDDGQPWVTYPAIDFLERHLTARHRVFEWGSGGSTLFFAARAGEVISVEHDRGWFEKVRDRIAAKPNVSHRLIEPVEELPGEELPGEEVPGSWRYSSGARGCDGLSFQAYVKAIEAQDDASLDLVVVDGRSRMGCVSAAAAKVAHGGWLLLDNANYPRYRERLDELRDGVLQGWREIGLAGPGPYSRTPCWETVIWERPREAARAVSGHAAALRQALAKLPVRPYDRELAGEILEIGGFEFELGERFSWEDHAESPRSRSLFLQSWHPLEPLFIDYAENQDPNVLQSICQKVCGWLALFGNVPLSRPHRDTAEHAGVFIAADTAIGSRFYRLAYLVAATATVTAIDDAIFEELLGALLAHRLALALDENFAPHSNHGVLQALAQVCGAFRFLTLEDPFASMLGMAEAYDQGKHRLIAVLSAQVCADGVHREHSPMYHVIVTNALEWIVTQGIVTDASLLDIAGRMQAAAWWMFDSRGRIANLGESDLEPDLTCAASGADRAPAQAPAHAVFPEGGYWFVKGPGVFLAQAAAFHSRVHKQADTCAFLWRDRGLDILIDAGRFGYVGRTAPGEPAFQEGFWYADARRRYVESTNAHNTLCVDRRNHPRSRSQSFGSGIVAAVERDRVFVCESSIQNLPRLTHMRVLALKPGEWLLCIDTVRARDGLSHLATQNFHLHPAWNLERQGESNALFAHVSGATLVMTCMFEGARVSDMARGRGVPERDDPDELFGWWSPRHMLFEPCEAISVSAEGDYLTLATLFTFADVEIDRAFTSFNTTRRRLRFRWRGPEGTQTLTIDRDNVAIGQSRLAIL